MITQFARFDEMTSGKESTKEDAQPANDKVRDAQELILPANDRGCGDNHRLGTSILDDWKIVRNNSAVRTSSHAGSVVAQRKLAKRRQTSRSHPHLQRLPMLQVGESARIAIGKETSPIRWDNHVRDVVRSRLEAVFVRRPGNSYIRHEVGLVAGR